MILSQGQRRGYKKQLADCAGCQQAYFSQMLKERVELTPEQAEKLCQFWALDELESEYFFQLVNLARAGTSSLRARIQKRLLELKTSWEERSASYEKKSIESPDQAAVYYAHWLYSAVHVFLSIKTFSRIETIAEHLRESAESIRDVLQDLQRIGLAVETNGSWRLTEKQIHAKSVDFFSELHHKNWRLQAIEQRRKPQENAIRYTSIHTLSRGDFIKIRTLLEQSIKNVRKTIEPSPEEMAACLVIDYFSI